MASVIDVLRLLPGVWVRERGPFGSQADISIRGAGFGQTLMLVDGVRLNDPQSGHHNGDIPVALEDVVRIELVAGAGSSLHGADAVGGVINVVTRQGAADPTGRVAAGAHGLVQASAAWRPDQRGALRGLSASLDRSGGFAPARDFIHQQARVALQLGGTAVAFSHLDKDFGAAGFYGPAPSHEWTTQTMVTARRTQQLPAQATMSTDAWFRSHGDRFLYDQRIATAQANEHRTHVGGGTVKVTTRVQPGVRLTAGAEGTVEWLRSASLGDRDESRVSGMAELEATAGRLSLYPSVRVDRYSAFGVAWSPSLAVALPIRPRLKWRTSVGRSFRVPTFTERYYVDPNHQATAALAPEHGWTADTGLDAYVGTTWVVSATGFVRRERDVIDWVRPTSTERWRTANIRRVSSQGAELALRGQHGPVSTGVHAAWTRVETNRLDGLSKYVDDYAPFGLGADVAVRWPGGWQTGVRLARRRPAGRAGYDTVDLRVARPVRRVLVFADVSNVGDVAYEEIRGVPMPGRWARLGLSIK
ncbi:MAG: TonB-dependent receptor plug domain-containing protein [Luteitalea sp.]